MVSTLSIGPWPGGLNLTSNRDLSPYLANDELGAAVNVQYTREGFIEARPGFKAFPNTAINSFLDQKTITILGTIYAEGQEVGVVQARYTYLGTPMTEIYYVTGDLKAYLKCVFVLDPSPNFTSVLSLNNSDAPLTGETPRGVFLFDGNVDNRCYRLEEIPSVQAPAYPVIMSGTLKIPKSDFSFSVKDRVFLVNKERSTLYWSALTINSLWFDSTEVDVNQVPTQRAIEAGFQGMDPSLDRTDDLTSVEFINNSFYLFKKTATYMFTYQAKPEEDGYMRKISDNLGAFDSTIYRDTIVLINERGIFSLAGTEFTDLQEKLNLRFEYYLDVVNPDAFITDFNGNILVGFRSKGKYYWYLLNGFTKGWSEWTFDYAQADIYTGILAEPSSTAYFCRTTSNTGIIIFTDSDNRALVYSNWKPDAGSSTLPLDYTLDGPKFRDPNVTPNVIKYIPEVRIYTKAQLGDSLLNFKKIYRSYIRFYLSDIPGEQWKFTINYNNYLFDYAKNPEFVLMVGDPLSPGPRSLEPLATPTNVITSVYKRTYQLPIHQQRAIEFVYEITRPFSKLSDKNPLNEEPDRPVQSGYYFLISGLWVDYEDRKRI